MHFIHIITFAVTTCMNGNRKAFWELKGMKGSPWHRLTEMAENMGGIFSFTKHKGPPQEALRVI